MKWKPDYKGILLILKNILNKTLIILGIFFFLSLLFSFTDYPFWAYYWLGTHQAELEKNPDYVVLMGGGGMPSADGLIRSYFAAEIAKIYPEAKIIVAIPADTSLHEESPDLLMQEELKMRGVSEERILFAGMGINTRTQALEIAGILGETALDTLGVRIVTSPEHMLRSVKAFRKVGFNQVGGRPSFENDIEEKLLIRKKESGEVGPKEVRSLNLRYNMWNYLKYEITVGRELCALAYYKLRGWI